MKQSGLLEFGELRICVLASGIHTDEELHTHKEADPTASYHNPMRVYENVITFTPLQQP